MQLWPIGVANSVSANHQFDPLDTIAFARQSKFEIIQLYLTDALLRDEKSLKKIKLRLKHFDAVYFHAEGDLNEEFVRSEYLERLHAFLDGVKDARYIIHFDESSNIDKLIKMIDLLTKSSAKIYVENYFVEPGKESAERNLKKFLALFTLATNFGHKLYPVLDIPRLFQADRGFETIEGLEWCYQILNFFGNRRIPLLLHLIDASEPAQERYQFTTLGQGYLPYDQILPFIQKTRPLIEGIIFEYEEKMNPLQSRDYLREIFQ